MPYLYGDVDVFKGTQVFFTVVGTENSPTNNVHVNALIAQRVASIIGVTRHELEGARERTWIIHGSHDLYDLGLDGEWLVLQTMKLSQDSAEPESAPQKWRPFIVGGVEFEVDEASPDRPVRLKRKERHDS